MWFSRQSRSVRVWFQAVTSTGILRTNLPSGSFHVTIIDPTDSANVTLNVTESSQRSGNYYFDVPSSFLVTNGVGDYNVSIEINSRAAGGSSPHVVNAHADVLHISQFDFDTLSGSIWNASSSQFNASGSTGYALNQAAGTATVVTASVDIATIVSGVWNAEASTFNVSGTMGSFQNMIDEISSSVSFTQGIENGSWLISGAQMIFYASGTNIELARFNLQDINGIAIDPSTQNPFRRIRV